MSKKPAAPIYESAEAIVGQLFSVENNTVTVHPESKEMFFAVLKTLEPPLAAILDKEIAHSLLAPGQTLAEIYRGLAVALYAHKQYMVDYGKYFTLTPSHFVGTP